MSFKNGHVFDFDPALVVERFDDFDGIKGWYIYPDKKMVTAYRGESIASLLASKGLYWVQNDVKHPDVFDLSWDESVDFYHSDKYKECQKEYESAQSKCLKETDKILILLTVVLNKE